MTGFASERAAESHARKVTRGSRGEDFTVFAYVDRKTNLTLFGVDLEGKRTGAALV